jgi:2-hydroxychromene-2-carboxylate isomerase
MAEPETLPKTLTIYIDYKSPYAYIAKGLVYELEREVPVRVDWLPYDLDLAGFMGTARLDERGRVVEEHRTAHQWRRVKYSYMDCRRQARKQGIVIRGTQKIWDSRLALCGLLYAKRRGEEVLRRYQDVVFERFWKRELDIENPEVVAGILAEAGADAEEFAAYFAGEGGAALAAICRDAEAKGVFGVPFFILDGESFWGSEHLPDIRAKLASA